MKLVDANVLLYAVNADAEHHASARRWLDSALSGDDTVAFAWIALLAFARLVTKAGLFPQPLTTDEAFDRIDAWLGQPNAVVVAPTARHTSALREMCATPGLGGNLVIDAHLAALAVEHKCTIVSYDHDFSLFPNISWEPPA
ncbi:MAG: type II toxin-antitoxin system VapC family toxin [Actinobacteria bacterium]|nr:type II toxin-antitoxin system VapC family toxin [Actinomycetota bacterium]